jgi:hypothetical protein
MKNSLITLLLLALASFSHADVKDVSSQHLLRCVTMSKKTLDSKNGQMKETLTSNSQDFYNFTVNLANGEISGANINTKDATKNVIISELKGGSFYRQISSFPQNNMTIYFQIQHGILPKDAPYAFIGMFFDYPMSGICFDSKKSM